MGHESRRNTTVQTLGDRKRLGAYDKFGREITPGDVLLIMGQAPVLWRVTAVGPVLDPGAPSGLVQLSMVASFVTGVQGGLNINDVIRVLDQSELSDAVSIADEEAAAQAAAGGGNGGNGDAGNGGEP